MDARMAAELLYESEATLRMVDTVLDEFCIAEQEIKPPSGHLKLELVEEDPAAGYDFCVRGYWQVQELLDCVKQARKALATPDRQTELGLANSSDRSHADAILALVDSLESLDDFRTDKGASALSDLRAQIDALINGAPAPRPSRRDAANNLLSEAEARLTRLSHFFEDADSAA